MISGIFGACQSCIVCVVVAHPWLRHSDVIATCSQDVSRLSPSKAARLRFMRRWFCRAYRNESIANDLLLEKVILFLAQMLASLPKLTSKTWASVGLQRSLPARWLSEIPRSLEEFHPGMRSLILKQRRVIPASRAATRSRTTRLQRCPVRVASHNAISPAAAATSGWIHSGQPIAAQTACRDPTPD